MKNKLIAFVLALMMVLPIFGLTSCFGKDKSKKEASVMQVDINPSVEFVVDTEGKIASVTALNDDGAVILSGEVFVGLTAEEAAAKMVEIAKQTGYISEADNKDITLTVSGGSAENLFASVKASVNAKTSALGIDSAVKKGASLAKDELKALVLQADPAITEEELADMSESDMILLLADARKEYAVLATEDFREAYLQFKDSKLALAEDEAVSDVIEKLGNAYASTLTSYDNAVLALNTAAEAVNTLYNSNFIDENSVYCKAVAKVKEYRICSVEIENATTVQDLLTLLQQEKYQNLPGISEIIQGLQAGAVMPTMQQAVYSMYQPSVVAIINTALAGAETALAVAKAAADQTVAVALNTLEQAKTQLELMKAQFPEEIKTALTENVSNIDKAVNDAKAQAFADFETAHKAAIDAMNADIAAQKQALIAATSKTAE